MTINRNNISIFYSMRNIISNTLDVLIFLLFIIFLIFSMIETRDLSEVINFPVSTRYITPLLFVFVLLRVFIISYRKEFIIALFLLVFSYAIGYIFYISHGNQLQYFYLNAGFVKMAIFFLNIYLFFSYKDFFYSQKIVRFVLIFILAVTLIAFFVYLYMSSIGLIPFSFNRILILSDFNSRFSGTFSEPNKLGFILGVIFFILLIEFKSKLKLLFVSIVFIIFYFYTQAKFSLIALPLSLLIAYILLYSKNIKFTNITKIVISFLIIVIFSIFIEFGLDEIVLDIFRKNISEDNINTFTTRIGFLLQSFKHLIYYPIGSGFGGYVVTSSPLLDEFTQYGINNGMNIWELRGYVDSPSFTFGPKDSLSFIIFSSGIVGLYFVLFLIFNLLKKLIIVQNYLLLALFLFIITNACIAIEIFELSLSSYFIVYIIYKLQNIRSQIETAD